MAIKMKRGTTDSWKLGPELVDFGHSVTKDKDSVIRAEGTELEMYVYTTSANEWYIEDPRLEDISQNGKTPGLPINFGIKQHDYDKAYRLVVDFEGPEDCNLEIVGWSGILERPDYSNGPYIDDAYKSSARPIGFVKWPAEKVGVAAPVPVKIHVSYREVGAYEELEEGQLGLEYTEDGNVKLKAGMPGTSKWGELPYISGNVVIVTCDADTNLCSHSAEEVNEMLNKGEVPVVLNEGRVWYPGDSCTVGTKQDRHFWTYDCDDQFIKWAELNSAKQFAQKSGMSLKQMQASINSLSPQVVNIQATISSITSEVASINDMLESSLFKDVISTSYGDLANLRDRGGLIPGKFYRITDYECYVSAEGSQALNSVDFDIIVQALGNSQLSEHAQATPRTMTNIGISPAVIKEEGQLIEDAVEFIYQEYVDDGSEYSGLEEHTKTNDIFVAYGYSENNEGIVVPILYKTDRCGLPSAGEEYDEAFAEPDWADEFYYVGRAIIDGEEYDKWQKIDIDYNWETPQKFVYTNVVTSYEAYSPYNFAAWELKYCLDNDTSRFEWANEDDGMGVIYYMKDEWGNEAPYDFKNIVLDINGIESYTFSTSGDEDGTEDGFFQDCVVNTLKGNSGILKLPHCGVRAIERQSNVVFGKDCENVSIDIQVEGIPSIQLDPGIQDEHITILPEHDMAGKNLIVRAPNTQEILL